MEYENEYCCECKKLIDINEVGGDYCIMCETSICNECYDKIPIDNEPYWICKECKK